MISILSLSILFSIISAFIKSYSLDKDILSISSTTLEILLNEYVSFINFFKALSTLSKFDLS